MNCCVVSFVYPGAEKFIESFINTLNFQSCKEFKLLIFNDGLIEATERFKNFFGETETIPVNGTATENRFYALNYLKKCNYEKIIFLDIDDQMSNNRVEICCNLLNEYDLVCNDLDLTDEKSNVIFTSYWSERIEDLSKIKSDFIFDKNIIGLGNTSIHKSILSIPISIAKNVTIADWFIFYQMLNNGNVNAVFTNRCKTKYRQHSDNMAGLRKITLERLEKVIQVKINHYSCLNQLGYSLDKEIDKLNDLLSKKNRININNTKQINYFWWEETEAITT